MKNIIVVCLSLMSLSTFAFNNGDKVILKDARMLRNGVTSTHDCFVPAGTVGLVWNSPKKLDTFS